MESELSYININVIYVFAMLAYMSLIFNSNCKHISIFKDRNSINQDIKSDDKLSINKASVEKIDKVISRSSFEHLPQEIRNLLLVGYILNTENLENSSINKTGLLASIKQNVRALLLVNREIKKIVQEDQGLFNELMIILPEQYRTLRYMNLLASFSMLHAIKWISKNINRTYLTMLAISFLRAAKHKKCHNKNVAYNNKKIVSLLSAGARPCHLMLAATQYDYPEIVETILDLKLCDINTKLSSEKSAIMIAIQYQSLEVLELLLRHGSDGSLIEETNLIEYTKSILGPRSKRKEVLNLLKKFGNNKTNICCSVL